MTRNDGGSSFLFTTTAPIEVILGAIDYSIGSADVLGLESVCRISTIMPRDH